MSAIRIVHVAGTEMVSVIDEATGLTELVEVAAIDEKADRRYYRRRRARRFRAVSSTCPDRRPRPTTTSIKS